MPYALCLIYEQQFWSIIRFVAFCCTLSSASSCANQDFNVVIVSNYLDKSYTYDFYVHRNKNDTKYYLVSDDVKLTVGGKRLSKRNYFLEYHIITLVTKENLENMNIWVIDFYKALSEIQSLFPLVKGKTYDLYLQNGPSSVYHWYLAERGTESLIEPEFTYHKSVYIS